MSGADKVFYTTGRLTSEMVIKSAQMGVPVVVSRSGITQMGLAVAELDATELGQVRRVLDKVAALVGQPQAAASIKFCPPSGAKLPPSSATSARS